MKLSTNQSRRSMNFQRVAAWLPALILLTINLPAEAASAAKDGTPSWHIASTPDDPYYRPFKSRFNLRPFNDTKHSVHEMEFRRGYEEFAEDNPRHALAPNSVDRNAGSMVVFLFALAALGSIFGALIVSAQLQDVHPSKHALSVAVCVLMPWVLLLGWIYAVVGNFFSHPMRAAIDVNEERWQCSAMIWYLMVYPPLTLSTFAAQVLAVCGPLLRTEKPVAMGRMLGVPNMGEATQSGVIAKIASVKVPKWLLYILTVLEVVSCFLGMWVMFFTGSNSQFCQPQVWWTSVTLATMSLVVVILFAATVCCGCCGLFLGRMQCVKDMVSSFRAANPHLVDQDHLNLATPAAKPAPYQAPRQAGYVRSQRPGGYAVDKVDCAPEMLPTLGRQPGAPMLVDPSRIQAAPFGGQVDPAAMNYPSGGFAAPFGQ